MAGSLVPGSRKVARQSPLLSSTYCSSTRIHSSPLIRYSMFLGFSLRARILKCWRGLSLSDTGNEKNTSSSCFWLECDRDSRLACSLGSFWFYFSSGEICKPSSFSYYFFYLRKWCSGAAWLAASGLTSFSTITSKWPSLEIPSMSLVKLFILLQHFRKLFLEAVYSKIQFLSSFSPILTLVSNMLGSAFLIMSTISAELWTSTVNQYYLGLLRACNTQSSLRVGPISYTYSICSSTSRTDSWFLVGLSSGSELPSLSSPGFSRIYLQSMFNSSLMNSLMSEISRSSSSMVVRTWCLVWSKGIDSLSLSLLCHGAGYMAMESVVSSSSNFFAKLYPVLTRLFMQRMRLSSSQLSRLPILSRASTAFCWVRLAFLSTRFSSVLRFLYSNSRAPKSLKIDTIPITMSMPSSLIIISNNPGEAYAKI